MERPQVEIQPKQRDITGEIVYLDEMRRQNEEPQPFAELGDTAIRMYESQVDAYGDGERPKIMDEYEHHDNAPSAVVASCVALANELLALKKPESSFTFVDIAVEDNPDSVLAKLQDMPAAGVLSGEDEQLAIESDGEYYPVLDIRKHDAELVGVGVRVWGWDDHKTVFTNEEGEQYKYPEHALVYPSDEQSSTRRLELSFGYYDKTAGSFSESVSLYLRDNGTATISSNVSAAAYAETGYEGHKGESLNEVSEEAIAEFGDLIAEIVGDKPQSIAMRINDRLEEVAEAAATQSAKQAVQDLIQATWPAQANYFLTSVPEDTDTTLAEQLSNEATADAATAAIKLIIEDWEQALS